MKKCASLFKKLAFSVQLLASAKFVPIQRNQRLASTKLRVSVQRLAELNFVSGLAFSDQWKLNFHLAVPNYAYSPPLPQKKYGERSQGKQTSLFHGGKLPRTCFYSDCVADELIKVGQGQKYGGIFVYYIFLLLIDSIKLHNFKHF